MKKRFFAVTAVVLLFTAGGFLFWFLTGGFWARPVTGQISDEAYREGRKTFYRREEYRPWDRGVLSGLPEQDVNMGFDIRSYDVSGFDLRDKGDILSTVTFDTDTVWPEKLPEGFLPDQILETGKDPGLGIRALHEQGITGKGVSIAIIDPAALIEELK